MILLLNSIEFVNKLNDKGVEFCEVSKEQAIHYLEEHNYYVKVSSYRHNFKKDEKGKYKDLDFFHLKDLSTIDMHLKFLILKTILNLEHSLKVNLLKSIENNGLDDVNLTLEFLDSLGNNKGDTGYNIKKELYRRRGKGYVGNLLDKFTHPNYPIWTFVEVISFGTLVKFIKFYVENYEDNFADCDILFRVRDIRNASAHSNCLIHNLPDKRGYYLDDIYKFLKNNLDEYNGVFIKRKLRNLFIHDFICLLYAFNLYVKSDEIKTHRFKEIKEFFDIRVIRNKDKYEKNKILIDDYKFVKKVIDLFCDNAI